ncbi:MAG: tRNA (adenosine(37)-N6)-threonylcarbamoyltransferase complex transferase subunit TsaD [Campylobacteraceae bacterium]|nr:tRNA (adenosine(37)-N6)-threonylcarbamoyltransferase complex transferase subunit TsaD [Campylobacteraceae bacterium]
MILSIESSCDDSSIAITRIKDYKILFHQKISQELDHAIYGGVVPERAARLHAIALPKILSKTLSFLPEVKAVAVTTEPGLSVTLVEGLVMAKALCISLDIPLLPINHLKGHIYSLFLEKPAKFPLGVLLVSGGHTQLLNVKSHEEVELLATTMDDSFGESFDKVAKMLGLSYPGGPEVEKRASRGDTKRFNFTVPLLHTSKLAFSYSGLKNQVRIAIEKLGKDITKEDIDDICAGFQKTAIAHLLNRLERSFKIQTFPQFAVVGGASANLALRESLEALIKRYKMDELLKAPLEFCSDNAAMIGRCGVEAYKRNEFVEFDDAKVSPRTKF